MKWNWKTIGKIALDVTGVLVPQVQVVERTAEQIIAMGRPTLPALTGPDKALLVINAALDSLSPALRTPRVKAAIASVNDAVVELHDALAEADAAHLTHG